VEFASITKEPFAEQLFDETLVIVTIGKPSTIFNVSFFE
jgi:hypothetical protein